MLDVYNVLILWRRGDMKHVFRLFLGMLILFVFQYNVLAAEQYKIRVVDIQKVQSRSKSFQRAAAILREKLNTKQKILDEEKRKILKMEEEIQKQSMVLSLDAREDKKREFAKKKRYYKYLYEEFKQEVKDAEIEATKKVSKELEKAVKGIADKEGYVLIFEKRTIGLVYYDDSLDITDQVIKAYDELKLKR
jgi:outer membrane protein